VIRLHDCRHTAASIMLSHGIPPIIVAGVTCPNFGRMLGHSLAILMTTYAHLARFAPYASNIPGTQDEAARLMDEILTPIPIDLRDLKR
jgi:hypothetical protein